MCHGAAMSRKSRRAGERAQELPLAEGAGEDEVGEGGSEEEDEGDESLGEDGEGEGRPHEVGVERLRRAKMEAGRSGFGLAGIGERRLEWRSGRGI